MAWVDNQEEEKENTTQQNQTQSVGGGSEISGGANSGTSPTTSGSAYSSTTPTSTAGVGAGGTGGWTNIQSYLQANKGDTNSANLLNKQVGSQFNQENQNLQSQADQTKSEGQSSVDSNRLGENEAYKLLKQAGNQYTYDALPGQAVEPNASLPGKGYGSPNINYGGNQYSSQPPASQSTEPSETNPQSYQDIVNGFQQKLTNQYQGPTSFAYGTSAPTQQYGSNLATDQGFNALMQSLYSQSANGQIGSGALNLQKQIDTNNDSLNSSRQNLLNQYAGLNQNTTDTIAGTNTALQNQQAQFQTDQQALRDYLTGQRTLDQQGIDSAVTSWNNQNATNQTQAMNQLLDVQNRANTVAPGENIPYWIYRNSKEAANPDNPGGADQNINRFYNAGTDATQSNVQGVNDQRNQFNSIADILGLGSKINYTNVGPVAASSNTQGYSDLIKKGATDWYQSHNPGAPAKTWNF